MRLGCALCVGLNYWDKINRTKAEWKNDNSVGILYSDCMLINYNTFILKHECNTPSTKCRKMTVGNRQSHTQYWHLIFFGWKYVVFFSKNRKCFFNNHTFYYKKHIWNFVASRINYLIISKNGHGFNLGNKLRSKQKTQMNNVRKTRCSPRAMVRCGRSSGRRGGCPAAPVARRSGPWRTALGGAVRGGGLMHTIDPEKKICARFRFFWPFSSSATAPSFWRSETSPFLRQLHQNFHTRRFPKQNTDKQTNTERERGTYTQSMVETHGKTTWADEKTRTEKKTDYLHLRGDEGEKGLQKKLFFARCCCGHANKQPNTRPHWKRKKKLESNSFLQSFVSEKESRGEKNSEQ